jgi:hypothetical protein
MVVDVLFDMLSFREICVGPLQGGSLAGTPTYDWLVFWRGAIAVGGVRCAGGECGAPRCICWLIVDSLADCSFKVLIRNLDSATKLLLFVEWHKQHVLSGEGPDCVQMKVKFCCCAAGKWCPRVCVRSAPAAGSWGGPSQGSWAGNLAAASLKSQTLNMIVQWNL